jgi:hypothetical protein
MNQTYEKGENEMNELRTVKLFFGKWFLGA